MPNNESGYSMVEVLVAILLLTAAILPMVGMFDSGLRAVNTSGSYDTARTLANGQLETAKSGSYTTARDRFPNGVGGFSPPTANSVTVTGQTVNAPAGFTYDVTKQFLAPPPADASPANFTNSTSGDQGWMKITVTSRWAGDKSYATSGVVAYNQ